MNQRMRQGQGGKGRSRGRSGGRRQQNPVNRVFESNGPDVKIRGNASHIAEKYNSLARDALVSGNTVTAENYFQHAEHYLRILAAAQAYNQQQQMAAQAAAAERMEQPDVLKSPCKPEDGEQTSGAPKKRRKPARAESQTENGTPEADAAEGEAESPAQAADGEREARPKKANGATQKRKKQADGEETAGSGEDSEAESESGELAANA